MDPGAALEAGDGAPPATPPPPRPPRGCSAGHIATPPVAIGGDRRPRGGGQDAGGGGWDDRGDHTRVHGSGGHRSPASWASLGGAGSPSGGGGGGGGDGDRSLPSSAVDGGSSADSSSHLTGLAPGVGTSAHRSSSLSASLQERFAGLRADLARIRSFFGTDAEEDSHASPGASPSRGGGGYGEAGESFFSTGGDGGPLQGGGLALGRHRRVAPRAAAA